MHRSLVLLAALGLPGTLACGGDDEQRVVEDTSAPDTSFPEVSFEVDAPGEINLPPDFGELCDGNEDCTTGFCVEGPSGFTCTKTCVEQCPAGWGCKGVQSGSADIVFVCVQDGAPDRDTLGGDTNVTDTVPPTDTQVDTTVADTDVVDTGPSPTNACEAAPGVGSDNLAAESTMIGGDFPDCIVGCEFETNPTLWKVDLRESAFTGAIGGFDADEHLFDFDDGTHEGPDIDVIALYAAPRTMLELAVIKDTRESFTEPLIYVSDGFQVRTFNSNVSDSNTCGRTTIAYPYVSELPVYVVLEEATNYDRWSPTGYRSGTVGGADYGWILRIRQTPFAPTELGRLSLGEARTLANETLTVGGQTRYYRAWAPGIARPTVTVTRRSGGEFSPSVAGMKTIAGELVWQRVEEDGDDNGVVVLSSNAFRPCIPQSECPAGFSCPPNLCTEADVEFVFAVFDFNGAAGPGTFGYDVTVRFD